MIISSYIVFSIAAYYIAYDSGPVVKAVIVLRQILTFILLTSVSLASPTVSAQEVIGWLEKVHVHFNGESMVMTGKMDSGAKTSSLSSEDYTIFLKDGRQWVRFMLKNKQGAELLIEKPVIRTVKIKRHFGELQRRPVITIGVCLGSIYQETEVSLVDRSGFNYKLLVGREFLAGKFLIDTGARFTMAATCQKSN
jgi:hypothetical protein